MNAIYTIGYGGAYYEAALQQVQNLAREGMIIDTRIVPHTKLVGFDQEDLLREYRSCYVHIPALGNRNYKGGPIELVDEESGLQQLEGLLARYPILLLCGCTDVTKCHRRYIANKLRERTGASICHLLTSFREHEVRTAPAPSRLEEWQRATARYFCVSCATPLSTGQYCKSCADHAAAAGQSRIQVVHCNFCGRSMAGRMGTECSRCETSRLLQVARLPGKGKKQRKETTGEQPTLW